MTTVILAEKPGQALSYAQSFSKYKKSNGYFQIFDSSFPDKDVYITFCFGHLVELFSPGDYDKKWGKWNLESLPIFPDKYQYHVSEDKEEQFAIVSKLLNQASTIVIATDCDREGENIAWSVIHHAGAYNDSKVYKRLWINSLEKKSIIEGFQNLREGKDYYPYFLEAQSRQISDWLIGMNASPLYSLHLQKKGVKDRFSVGRVQTPTLYMIYKKEEQIRNFQKKTYFELEAQIKTQIGDFRASLIPNEAFAKKKDVITFLQKNEINSSNNEGNISSVEVNVNHTASPFLFSLSSLQSKINQLYKESPSNTLKAVQTLYESKFLTYPRTDCHYITDNEFEYLQEHIYDYQKFLKVKNDNLQLTPRKRYVNAKKVQEHHAIVLTRCVPTEAQFSKMTELEQKVYLLVAKTTLAMFFPDYDFEETVIQVEINNLVFQAKGQLPLNLGWKKLFESEKEIEPSPLLPRVVLNEKVNVTVETVEKETRSPKRYTEGTLLTAMKTAGKIMEDEDDKRILKDVEGIGTEATRASIIESLKKREYVELKKSQLYMTQKGNLLCQAIENQHLLTSAEMTAKWEKYLRKIGNKEGNQEIFINNIKKFIIHLIDQVPNDIEKLNLTDYERKKEEEEQKNVIGVCPKCGESIVSRKGFYACSAYPDCRFTLSEEFRSKKLTKKNVKQLLEGQETTVTKIKKKDKSIYNAIVRLNDKGFIEFVSFSK